MFKDGVTESQIIANLRGEFLTDSRSRLNKMIELRETAAHADEPEEAYTAFRAELHTMKGMGQSFGFASITMISRRLEQFLMPVDAAAFPKNDAVVPYLDAIGGILDAGEELDDDALDAVLDGLAPPPDA